jgi:hypothetical protein
MKHATRTALLAGLFGLVAAAFPETWRASSFAATLSGPMEYGRHASVDTSEVLSELEAKPGEPRRLGPFDSEPSAVGGSLPAPSMMTEIATWLAANFDLPLTDDLPRLEFASPSKLIAIRLGGFVLNQSESPSAPNPAQPPLSIAGELAAIYHTAKRTIYLPEGWSGKSHAETSVLVHEMVHHLQNVGGIKYPCPDAREKPAYLAQDQWLSRFGLDLEAAFGIDLFTVLVRSACFH